MAAPTIAVRRTILSDLETTGGIADCESTCGLLGVWAVGESLTLPGGGISKDRNLRTRSDQRLGHVMLFFSPSDLDPAVQKQSPHPQSLLSRPFYSLPSANAACSTSTACLQLWPRVMSSLPAAAASLLLSAWASPPTHREPARSSQLAPNPSMVVAAAGAAFRAIPARPRG